MAKIGQVQDKWSILDDGARETVGLETQDRHLARTG